MRIFQKATVYAYKEIPDNLSTKEQQELVDEFQTDLNLDLDNLGYGGNSNYKFVHDSNFVLEKEMQKESFEYEKLLEDELNISDGHWRYMNILNIDKDTSMPISNKSQHEIDIEFAKYDYKKCLEKSRFSKMINNDDIELLKILDKTCLIDAQAVIFLTQKHNDKKYGLEKAKDLVKEISPVWGLRNAEYHPSGQLGYYNDVEKAIYKVISEHKAQTDNKKRGTER